MSSWHGKELLVTSRNDIKQMGESQNNKQFIKNIHIYLTVQSLAYETNLMSALQHIQDPTIVHIVWNKY